MKNNSRDYCNQGDEQKSRLTDNVVAAILKLWNALKTPLRTKF
jgi:hypothetical protein